MDFIKAVIEPGGLIMSEQAHPAGVLYVVATPIGNLSDLSPRAALVLREVDLVAAEDTRRTRQLLSHFDLHKPLESFHGDSDEKKTERLVRQLLAGRSLAYVSDGGTPGIADPGRDLVGAARRAGVSVIPIPGPSALVAALSASGLLADRFIFAGFPPRKSGERREFLQRYADLGDTIVLYEAPHRLLQTLQDIAEVCDERDLVVARELTKKHEEILKGTAVELAETFSQRQPRGEFVVMIAAGSRRATAREGSRDLVGAAERLLAAGLSARDAAGILADLGAASRREAYQLLLQAKKEKSDQGEN